MKALLLERDEFPAESIRKLKEFVDVEFFDCADQAALYEKLERQQYGVIFTRLGIMLDKKAIAFQHSLKYIVSPTTGLNHIDLEGARTGNIEVISLQGEYDFLSGIKSTAEHTWALLLSVIRNLPAAIDHVRDGNWERKPFLADELSGKTLGIIGFGRLGKIVARYAMAFGMNVIVNDVRSDTCRNFDGVTPVPLDELLPKSDVVLLLISWSESNENFMDEVKFNMMKPNAFFVNTARGELVDESAMLKSLQAGRLKGAAVDVLRGDSGWNGKVEASLGVLEYVKDHSNLLVTPHMGGYGRTSIANTRAFIADKFISLISALNHKK
jgi:D-3-phosphoglycerate dehydrogenase